MRTTLVSVLCLLSSVAACGGTDHDTGVQSSDSTAAIAPGSPESLVTRARASQFGPFFGQNAAKAAE